MTIQAIKPRKDINLEQLLEQVIISGAIRQEDLESIGDKLGIYDVMCEYGPLTTTALADLSQIRETTVSAWLGSMLAGECVTYDPNTGRYSLWSKWSPLR